MGFGAGDHACLGAAHDRAVIRTLLATLTETVGRIDLHKAKQGTRDIGGIVRAQGFTELSLSF